MNKCVICNTLFETSNNYPNKKTCSKQCLSKLLKIYHKDAHHSKAYMDTLFKKGNTPFNKGRKRNTYMSADNIRKCSKTHIQYQYNSHSPLSKIENRYLPHNTLHKGVVVQRTHMHKSGKYKGNVETEYYINIDWRGNRKPNNLYKRYVWEVNHQQDIPRGYVIYLKDGNSDNITIDNLELITRAELLKRNSNR